ncbi:MAG: hypothetical protein ACOCOC_08815, partial [Prevotella sp.]
GATDDGRNIARLLPNVASNNELVNLVQDGDLLGYIRAPMHINVTLPCQMNAEVKSIIKGRISHAEMAYADGQCRPRQISLWDPGNSRVPITPKDRPLHDDFDKPPIGIYRVSLRNYGIAPQREKELKAEVKRWMRIVQPVIFPHETMDVDPVDFIDVDTLARIAARCIGRAPADTSPLFNFKLNCVQWSTLVFSLAVCFPLSRTMLSARGWLTDYERNWSATLGFAADNLEGLEELPIPLYTIEDAIWNTLDLYFPQYKQQLINMIDAKAVEHQLHANGIRHDQRTIMPAAFMMENRLRAMGVKRKTKSVFEYIATVVPEDQLMKIGG